jgi:hypothetical protein
MLGVNRRAETRLMPTELLADDLLHTRDAIDLPPLGEPVEGRAARSDSYPIHVTRTLPETVERLAELVGGAQVAVITDRTVADLHGEAMSSPSPRASVTRHPSRCWSCSTG